jgi:hypothetical protein
LTVLEGLEAEQKERERQALVITLGALRMLLWEPPEESGINSAYRKLLTHAEQVLRHELLPRYTSLVSLNLKQVHDCEVQPAANGIDVT